jgi:hypothetical protein
VALNPEERSTLAHLLRKAIDGQNAAIPANEAAAR